MGYSYGRSASGRMALSCDNCGHVGGVSKRRCPVNYCTPTALCRACNATVRQNGTWAEWHVECPRMHAEYVAQQAEKAAHPDLWARAAWSDSPAHGLNQAPKGMVRVLTYGDTIVDVPQENYNPSVAGFGA